MRDTVYLVLNSRRVDRMLRTRLGKLKGGEVAVKLTVEVADSNFRSPLATAELFIPNELIVSQPEVDIQIEEEFEVEVDEDE